MLVTFTSSTSGQIMTFAPVARQLLEIIGKECSAQGVITVEQLPEAIQRLRAATVDARQHPPAISASPPDADDDETAENTRVGLAQRAYPLIELLEWTRKEEGFVLWNAAQNF